MVLRNLSTADRGSAHTAQPRCESAGEQIRTAAARTQQRRLRPMNTRVRPLVNGPKNHPRIVRRMATEIADNVERRYARGRRSLTVSELWRSCRSMAAASGGAQSGVLKREAYDRTTVVRATRSRSSISSAVGSGFGIRKGIDPVGA